jgi:hypothetical protein
MQTGAECTADLPLTQQSNAQQYDVLDINKRGCFVSGSSGWNQIVGGIIEVRSEYHRIVRTEKLFSHDAMANAMVGERMGGWGGSSAVSWRLTIRDLF